MESQASSLSAFRLEVSEDGMALVTLDVPGESQNTLKAEFAEEFEKIADQLRNHRSIRAMVIMSGKKDSFLAGADLSMLKAVTTAEEATRLSEKGQRAFDQLERLPFPTVAAIHGPCLGGGLELALACASRICTDDPKTVLSAPEVMLGLLPGAGGTQRLPRLIGLANSLDLMLTGKNVRPAKALSLGLVDEVVPVTILKEAALALAKKLADGASKKKRGPKASRLSQRIQSAVLEETHLGRLLLFQQARKALMDKTLGNYPAPERILDAVAAGYGRDSRAGYQTEAKLFGELVVSPESRQLMGIFFAQNELKKSSGVADPTVVARAVTKVGILGAGLMGAGIALVTANKAGLPVRMKDRDHPAIGRGLKSVQDFLERRVKRRAMTRAEADRQWALVTGSLDYVGMERCEVVVEAVFEDLELKHQMIREVEALTGDATIFASNTSSIPISLLAQASSRPENVIGMHYFSPVEKMPLLEIIRTKQTADWVTATCVELGKRQGKTVIVVNDGVGFYTSRILAPFMNEAARILAEGIRIETIDDALKRFGFPVGPITLIDEVGLDVAEKVGHILIDAFGSRMEPPAVMQRLIDDGRKGRKNGRGFYTYNGKKKRPDETVYTLLDIRPDKKMDRVALAERCALSFVNEAVRCLEEGILSCPRDGDIGAIFGLGFPPFRGGPFRYIDSVGADNVVSMLESLASRHGDRFAPAGLLVDHAKGSKRFYL